MKRTFKFSVIEWCWGVAIDLTAHFEAMNKDASLISPEFEGAKLTPTQIEYIKLGLRGFEEMYALHGSFLSKHSFVIDRIDFPATDFQEEGLACAVAGWLCLFFDIAPNPFSLSFDKTHGRYRLRYEVDPKN